MPPVSRDELLQLLRPSQLHAIGARAQALRLERFGVHSSLPLLGHLWQGGSARWCSVCGTTRTESPAEAGTAPSDLHVQPGPGPDSARLLEAIPAAADDFATAQVGCASDWIEAAGNGAEELLRQARDRGLRVLSDGILPRVHPARGAERAARWQHFWRAAAGLGFVGHCTVLHGAGHSDEQLLDQIDAIVALQRECQPFVSARLVVDPGEEFRGVQDGLLTHGIDDLRSLAACRIGLAEIPHLSFAFDRSDLKMAHIALASGADDLEGSLELRRRSPREEANSNDLSVDEMGRWMREAGMEPILRNGAFETRSYPRSASLESA